MIRISSLYSLENVSDCYFFDEHSLSVINITTGNKKTISVNKRGYPVVYLQRKNGKHQMNIPMHKIVALACINNGKYSIIEHLNDNKLDYRPENLAFSSQKNNSLRAFDNKKRMCKARTFKVVTTDGDSFCGTMREISKLSGIPMGTLYDNLIYRCSDTGICPKLTQIKTGLLSIIATGQQTIERHSEYTM